MFPSIFLLPARLFQPRNASVTTRKPDVSIGARNVIDGAFM
jgi:hypothetical protein